jgi:hypothetical protein
LSPITPPSDSEKILAATCIASYVFPALQRAASRTVRGEDVLFQRVVFSKLLRQFCVFRLPVPPFKGKVFMYDIAQ